MSITPTYSLTIIQLDTKPSEDGLTNVVIAIQFTYTATVVQNGQTYTAFLSQSCDAPAPSASDFIPYDQLTPTIVEGWVNEQVDFAGLQRQLADILQQKMNPPFVVLPLPW